MEVGAAPDVWPARPPPSLERVELVVVGDRLEPGDREPVKDAQGRVGVAIDLEQVRGIGLLGSIGDDQVGAGVVVHERAHVVHAVALGPRRPPGQGQG